MATIVRHKKTGVRFVLLGAGYGAHRSERGDPFVQWWSGDVDAGFHPMLCVCGDDGTIGFIAADGVVVESVGSESPSRILSAASRGSSPT